MARPSIRVISTSIRSSYQSASPARTTYISQARASQSISTRCVSHPVTAGAWSPRWSPRVQPAVASPTSTRYNSTSVARGYKASTLTPNEYEKVSNIAMEILHEHLERLVEEYSPEGANGWEVEYSSGVLTLSIGPHGTYVINKQPPNQQIWLSSPFSGPLRFSHAYDSSSPSASSSTTESSSIDPSLPPCVRAKSPTDKEGEAGTWFYPRDNTTIGSLLDREIRSVLVDEVGKGEAEGWEGVGVL